MVCQLETTDDYDWIMDDQPTKEYDSTSTESCSQDEHEILIRDHDDNNNDDVVGKQQQPSEGGTVFQTSLNIGKLCMCSGTLALPFAAEKGGLVFNAVGLGIICFWNYYSSNCLLRCLDYMPGTAEDEAANKRGGNDDNEGGGGLRRGGSSTGSMYELEQQSTIYGSVDCDSASSASGRDANDGVDDDDDDDDDARGMALSMGPPPPNGTTVYGSVAWYACGPKGLLMVDSLMMSLYFGLVIAYEAAMQSFIEDTPLTTGSRRIDLLIPSAVVAAISCAPDMSFLSKFSGMGLLAVVSSFAVIAWQGFRENGFSGFATATAEGLNSWPEDLSAASSWFGVVAFGYGVSPFVFNFRNSLANPQDIGLCLQIGLSLVYAVYITFSNGIRVLFSPGGHVFDGDVLQVMPTDGWVSLMVRLLMTFAVALTAPLIVVPCGELIEGKIGMNEEGRRSSSASARIAVRVTFCGVCTLVAAFLGSGFVHIVSFVGCFCVSITSFVLPPLFSMRLSHRRSGSARGGVGRGIDADLVCDAVVLLVGIVATVVTSTLTFRELMEA